MLGLPRLQRKLKPLHKNVRRLCLKIKSKKEKIGYSSVVECLPGIYMALDLNPNIVCKWLCNIQHDKDILNE